MFRDVLRSRLGPLILLIVVLAAHSNAGAQPTDVDEILASWSTEQLFTYADLLVELHSDDSQRRCQAVYGLARPSYREVALANLSDTLLHDKSEVVRRLASEVLCSFDESALPALERALHDPSPSVRLRAVVGIASHVSIVSEHVFYNGKENDQERLDRLNRVKTRLLKDSDPVIRGLMQVAWSFETHDPPGKDAALVIPLILSAVDLEKAKSVPPASDELDSRWGFEPLALLGALGPAAAPVVPRLLAELEHFDDIPTGSLLFPDSETARCSALLSSLVRIGSPATPHLLRGIESRHPVVRKISATALATIDRESELPIPVLIESLQGQFWSTCIQLSTRRIDVCILATCGVRCLSPLLNTARHNENVRRAARDVMVLLPRERDVVRSLAGALQDESAEIRSLAAFGLGHQGKEGAAAREQLTRSLDDPIPEVRQAAREALVQIDEALQQFNNRNE